MCLLLRMCRYGDWRFWKAVEVGQIPLDNRLGDNGMEDLKRIRDEVKSAVGESFYDGGYSLLTTNCYRFCEALLTHFGITLVPGFLEAFNDEGVGLPTGTTYNVLYPKTVMKRHCTIC